MSDNADAIYRRAIRQQAAAEYAHRERAIRADLIEDVRDAIFAETDAWTSSNIERMAEIAVDTVADYYRRARTVFGG